jgi:hypothetical protein
MPFVLSPRRSGATVAASESLHLENLKVKRETMMRAGEYYFPTYTLHDTAAGRSLGIFEHISGGRLDDAAGACVAAYKDPSSGAVVIVKTLPHDDDTLEAAAVRSVAHLECLRGIMVPARLGRSAKAPRAGAARSPKHYGVVLMYYAGQPLTTLNLRGAAGKAALVTRGVAAACARLLACGLVHVDLKLANVLYSGLDYNSMRLSLCDYGGLAPLGTAAGTATYPPPEHPFGTGVRAGERVMAYQLGVLLLSLFADDLEVHLRFTRPAEFASNGGARAAAVNCDDEPTEHVSAQLGLQEACLRVLGALRARDETMAALVRLAWAPGTTIQQLIEALDAAVCGSGARDAAATTAAATETAAAVLPPKKRKRN